MDTNTINNYLSNTTGFIGTFSRDRLPKRMSRECGLVANTDDSTSPGQHWIAIYIDKNGVGEYFDSFGFPPSHQDFYNFLNNNCPNGYFFNKQILQCLTCITCGHYCIAYLKMRSNGISYNEFFKIFTHNQLTNDKLIRKYVNLI